MQSIFIKNRRNHTNLTTTWEQRELGSISEKVTKKNQDMVCDEVFTNSAEYGIISQRDFFDKDIANSENIDGYYIVEPNDFVYNPRISNLAPFGPIRRNKLEKSGAMSPLYYVFRTRGVDYGFLEYYFKTNGWHSFMHLNGNSGARSDRFAIRDDIFKEMPITIPQNIVEQQAVGKYFTNLDNLITLHQRKYSLLFIRTFEILKEVCFFLNVNAWEQRELGEILNERNIQHPQSKEFPLVSFTVENGVTPKTERYEREQLVVGDKSSKKYKETRLDDIVYNPANLKFGAIARNKYGNAVFSPIYVTFDVNKNITIPSFVEMLVTKSDFIQFALQYQQGTVYERMSVSVDDFIKLTVDIPSLDEQKQIGTYFQNLDHLITLHQRKPFQRKNGGKNYVRRC